MSASVGMWNLLSKQAARQKENIGFLAEKEEFGGGEKTSGKVWGKRNILRRGL